MGMVFGVVFVRTENKNIIAKNARVVVFVSISKTNTNVKFV
jgi:hypothetical protein